MLTWTWVQFPPVPFSYFIIVIYSIYCKSLDFMILTEQNVCSVSIDSLYFILISDNIML
jgi:hypothetical protein|uniref:Uncharacterized protein n=1 Tax=Thorea hispida TaxID=202687 RepID=A0A1Z1XAP0_9FLOR|nr:hypothetical protein [Thorea hispida]